VNWVNLSNFLHAEPGGILKRNDQWKSKVLTGTESSIWAVASRL
jgi:hypothetical protein